MSKRLLLLTQYFPPEVGAPQNRLFELALRLAAMDVSVEVITAMPNYPQMEIYEGYRGKSYCFEIMSGIPVHRSAIYVSKNKSIVSRLRNYFSFVISSRKVAAKLKGSYDFLMCESPPLFLGYSALYLARKTGAKLIFNVSDLWPESAEKLGVVTNSYLLALAYRLERKLYLKSALVTGQTMGICRNISERFPNVKTHWLPNGVDLNYFKRPTAPNNTWRQQHTFAENDFVVLYAGIIGIAQGLEVIINAAKQVKDRPALKFVLMGSGPVKTELQDLVQRLQLNNVYFLPTVAKSQMPYVLAAVNAAVIPLRKLELFKGAIPSKIFENLAMEVPVLLGVDGEARTLFVEEGKCALYFEPENAKDLARAIVEVQQNAELRRRLAANGRGYVEAKFNRDTIAADFVKTLMAIN